MGLSLVREPDVEPLTLGQAKEHLRITHNAQDTLVMDYIAAARSRCEEYERRAYVTQTWELTLDHFPCVGPGNPYAAIRLPRPPVQSVESLVYIDGDGVEQTMAPSDYALKDRQGRAVLVPAYGTTWPATRREMDAVRVRYVAGYGDTAADVPERVRQAMRFYIGHFFVNPTQVVTGTIVTELPEGARYFLTDRAPVGWG